MSDKAQSTQAVGSLAPAPTLQLVVPDARSANTSSQDTSRMTRGVPDARAAVAERPEKPVPLPQLRRAESNERRHRNGTSKAWRRLRMVLSFLVFVGSPTTLVSYYLFFVAAPQYMVETQFAVRGEDSAPTIDGLGLSALPGLSNQDSDSYIVQNYIRSVQVVKDIEREGRGDVRALYARPFIDPLHRVDADIPYVDFETLWQWQTAVEFSSITGNTTLRVYAFTPSDSVQIARALIGRAEATVNSLSANSRRDLLENAKAEVERTEGRLRTANLELQALQNASQSLDIEGLAKVESELVGRLEADLAELETRRRTLIQSVNTQSPTVRILDRRINAQRAQIEAQRANIGTGSSEGDVTQASGNGSIADLSLRFVEQNLNVEFAKTAYTRALEALETAEAEARKQQRYLAVFVPPDAPQVSRYPRPYLFTAMAFLWFMFLWLVGLFLWRTVRDHTA